MLLLSAHHPLCGRPDRGGGGGGGGGGGRGGGGGGGGKAQGRCTVHRPALVSASVSYVSGACAMRYAPCNNAVMHRA